MPVITPRQIDPNQLNVPGLQNICAMLDAIAYTEGTDNASLRPTGSAMQPSNPYYDSAENPHYGYDVIVGGSLMPATPSASDPGIVVTDYSKHPNKLVRLNAKLSSTAAGRYQILYRFWKHYQDQLDLPDFSPLSQNL